MFFFACVSRAVCATFASQFWLRPCAPNDWHLAVAHCLANTLPRALVCCYRDFPLKKPPSANKPTRRDLKNKTQNLLRAAPLRGAPIAGHHRGGVPGCSFCYRKIREKHVRNSSPCETSWVLFRVSGGRCARLSQANFGCALALRMIGTLLC